MRPIENPRAHVAATPRGRRRELPEEVPIALVYDGETFAVMLATPADVEDFAVGFTRTEGLSTRDDGVEIVTHPNGIECRLALDAAGRRTFERRRRMTTGGSSCGLCGMRGLARAVPPPPTVGGRETRFSASELRGAVAALRDHQPLHDRTRAAHAAGFHVPGRGLVAVREDVGRHNALDKLAGALGRAGEDPTRGAVVLTSRVSVEMVQKSAMLGAAAIVAVSAPTSLAVRTARAAGLTLVGDVRGGAGEVFAGAERLLAGPTIATGDDPAAPSPRASASAVAPPTSVATPPEPARTSAVADRSRGGGVAPASATTRPRRIGPFARAAHRTELPA